MQHILYLKLENDIYSATVTSIPNDHHLQYHVLFQNGYENIFFTDAETGNWIEEDLGETELARHFGERIAFLGDDVYVPCKALSWCRASIANMVINFGFCINRKNNGHTIFEVYGDNHKFLCNLEKNETGQWDVYNSLRVMTEYQYANLVQVIISIFEGMADVN